VPLFLEDLTGDRQPAADTLGLEGEAFTIRTARGYLAPGGGRRVRRRRQFGVPSEKELESLLGFRAPVDLRLVGAEKEEPGAAEAGES
jgi:hypothetical protein